MGTAFLFFLFFTTFFLHTVFGVYFQGCPEGYCAFPFLKTNSFPANATTIEFWAKFSVSHFTAAETGIFNYATEPGGNTTFSVVALKADGELRVYINGSFFSTGVQAPDMTWFHICISWKSSDGELSLYLNAIRSARGILSPGYIFPSTGTVVLGQLMVCVILCLYKSCCNIFLIFPFCNE